MADENNIQTTTEAQETNLGPILAILLIVLVLILGGLYLWGAQLSKKSTIEDVERHRVNDEPETVRAEADTKIFSTVSTSNTLEAIEADLSGTNIDVLDTDMSALENEVTKSIGE